MAKETAMESKTNTPTRASARKAGVDRRTLLKSLGAVAGAAAVDRKSTRLNSSH